MSIFFRKETKKIGVDLRAYLWKGLNVNNKFLKELFKTKYSSFGFKTSELKNALSNYFRNSSQIRYKLKKLISRKIVKKAKGKSFYLVTKFGWKWLWATICANHFFKNPIISRCFKKDLEHSASQPSNIEKSYLLIHQGLTLITQGVAII